MNVSELIKALQETPAMDAEVFLGGADVVSAVGDFTGGAAEDIFELTAHGLVADQAITLLSKAAAAVLTGISVGDTVYVSATSLTADDFSVSATVGGAVIANTADGLAVFAPALATVDLAAAESATFPPDAPGAAAADPGTVLIG